MKATELRPRNWSTLFRIPKSDENICCFQISAATTGMRRNGVISSAGSSGSRRRHGEENGSRTLPFRVSLPVSVASAAVTTGLLNRVRRDPLALAYRVRVLHRSGNHAREELGTPIADILELRNADVLHTR